MSEVDASRFVGDVGVKTPVVGPSLVAALSPELAPSTYNILDAFAALRDEVRELRKLEARLTEVEKRNAALQEVVTRMSRDDGEDLSLANKRRLRRFLRSADLDKLHTANTRAQFTAIYDQFTDQAMVDGAFQPELRVLVREYIVKAVKNRKDHLRRVGGNFPRRPRASLSDSESEMSPKSKGASLAQGLLYGQGQGTRDLGALDPSVAHASSMVPGLEDPTSALTGSLLAVDPTESGAEKVKKRRLDDSSR